MTMDIKAKQRIVRTCHFRCRTRTGVLRFFGRIMGGGLCTDRFWEIISRNVAKFDNPCNCKRPRLAGRCVWSPCMAWLIKALLTRRVGCCRIQITFVDSRSLFLTLSDTRLLIPSPSLISVFSPSLPLSFKYPCHHESFHRNNQPYLPSLRIRN